MHELTTRRAALRGIVQAVHLTAMRQLPRQKKFTLGQLPDDPASSIACLAKYSRYADSF